MEEIYWRGPALELQHLYRAIDFLHDHKEKIEESLYWRLADLLSLDVDLVFYDTIERVKEDLKGWRLNRCNFVADAGMVSEENLALLRRGGGRFIVAMPWRRGTAEAVSHPGRFQEVRENVQIKEVRVGDRRYVVCFNPKEAER